MFKKLTAILCALAMICFALPGCAETAGRPEPGVTEGERYVSDHLEGASALYAAGQSVTLDNVYIYGAGYATDQEITDQIPNQYGLCAAVLAAGEGSDGGPSVPQDGGESTPNP